MHDNVCHVHGYKIVNKIDLDNIRFLASPEFNGSKMSLLVTKENEVIAPESTLTSGTIAAFLFSRMPFIERTIICTIKADNGVYYDLFDPFIDTIIK